MIKTNCAIIGSGNIGTDLMLKISKTSPSLNLTGVIGIDPASEGLAMAQSLNIPICSEGLQGFMAMPEYADTQIFFDATSAGAHKTHHELISQDGKQMIDLTPAAIGPYCVPVVNLSEHLQEQNVNMVTCGGQATIPMVAAVNQISSVRYAEIVASVSSKSAGPGTRANIDEFTQTTALGLEKVGGADRAKAIIVLNPADPPLLMRNTVFTLCDPVDQQLVKESVEMMVSKVQSYVPGYRLKQEVQFERFGSNNPCIIPGYGEFEGLKASIFLEVEGAGHYLPKYAGNLDIMTSAAMGTAQELIKLSS
ncbi:acetaldehyde dehydrogenase (acetylating) [Gammaproteobacteria bacterium]|jgi:acetaldehyde dehydrogenase|nr:acetaldehyde dehydrogenase (acetylating) [Gammaproteobacteria bacterium]MDA8924510.1 acetaldehyde dehydrogenase (acetylating) [Gammaproteobacteria bacterium]MDA9049111.1 acetaldehyde dehydrogenase (acetylating) [Gammaproteobacteria bacterium]MDA9154065.1 acetaldehyde dehydrogenase (acetylating) [Gammaproteobacteria bacterium]MDB4210144.1 acetaldehyde dehydrogenase (acetylating) [Gammaproteobacteria bacterium]|tara:strand:+ start:2821 stop:3744 length:924 start_codon:yes stop_codon:yes gene_type:complete